MAKRVIVTIGREFGSGGREIGKALADSLGVEFYDKELLEVAAKESGISRDLFESNDEKPVSSLLYSMSVNPYSMGNLMGVDHVPINQKLFLAQFDAIRKIVRERDCVIVGALRRLRAARRAGLPQRVHPRAAPVPRRAVKRLYEMSGGEAKDMISKIDKKRAAYYNSYSDKKWGEIGSYHLLVRQQPVVHRGRGGADQKLCGHEEVNEIPMRYSIDRFEGNFAILEAENGETIGVERARLPREAGEGDIVVHEIGEFKVDAEATAARRARIREKMEALWEK